MKKAVVLLVMLCGAAWLVQRRARPEALRGLWFDREPRGIADEVRFYFFGKDGIGLYRYGQAGHNQTTSFDWHIAGDRLELTFRKSGEHARTRFVLGEDKGRRTLTLEDDPRGPGRVRYRYTATSVGIAADEPLFLPSAVVHEDAKSVAGRVWMDLRRYATGGQGFVMYQLSDHAASPGWNVGWHHVGDFDDWTTELLEYRLEAGALRFHFPLRGGDGVTPIELGRDRDATTLLLPRDPRNFYHRTRLLDAGPSF